MSLGGVHVLVCTPCYGGQVHQGYMRSVIGLMQTGQSLGFRVSVELLGGDSLITRSRNTLVAKFLNMESATHLLFVDADISFEAGQVVRMLEFGEEVVAGVYPLKGICWDDFSIERLEKGEPPDAASLRYVGYPAEGDELEMRDGFMTGQFAGAGCMLIRRSALVKMVEVFPEARYTAAHTGAAPDQRPNQFAFFDCMIDPATGHYLSEDYAFCLRWRSTGGRVWLDTRGRLVHAGTHEFAGRPDLRFR